MDGFARLAPQATQTRLNSLACEPGTCVPSSEAWLLLPPHAPRNPRERPRLWVLCRVWMAVLATAASTGFAAAQAPDQSDQPALEVGGAARRTLEQRGIALQMTYTGEVFAITSGGLKTGATYDGVLECAVDLDLDKFMGWKGGSFHVNGYQIHGQGPANFAGNVFTISNIEALLATRLYELWFEQALFAGSLKIRIGQLAADGDFLASKVASHFLNGTFGWPGLLAADLPAGGPAYPLATPGLRAAFIPSDRLTVAGAIYNGSPADPNAPRPEESNRDGLDFRLKDPPLVMVESQYKYGRQAHGGAAFNTIKFGGWFHFGDFADQRTGAPLRRYHGLYAVVDHLVYALPSSGDKGISAFGRITGSPGDRDPIDFYFDAGLSFSGFLSGRPDDVFSAAFGYGHFSSSARAADRDAGLSAIRDHEAVFEASYEAELMPGWWVIPDFQYVWHPGGNIPDANDPTKALQNVTIVGLRSALKF